MVRTPLSNKSNTPLQRHRRGKTEVSSRLALRSSCIFSSDPPPGCQFLTTFDCKYYGSTCIPFDLSQPFLQAQCMGIVQQVLSRNKKRSVKTIFGITDKGLQATKSENNNNILDLTTEELFKIVPGTLKTKRKSFTVVLVVQLDPNVSREEQLSARRTCNLPCHVFQCAHRADSAYMYEAAKRMWRDHMFNNLLDISTEEAQEQFSSFMIQQDIEAAYAKRTTLLMEDTFNHLEQEDEQYIKSVINNNNNNNNNNVNDVDYHSYNNRRASSLIETDLIDSQIEIDLVPRWV